MLDFAPAAQHMADIIVGVPEDRLDGPTPCPAYTVRDLLDHIGGLTIAFTAAATKADLPGGSQPPSGDGSRLGDDWRSRVAADLESLVAAWRDPDAWTGMTKAGGIDLPGEVAGLVAVNELVIHAWDVAKATGQAYDGDTATVAACRDFVAQFSGPDDEESRGDIYGPVVDVPADAPLIDQLIGLSGRDPGWSPQ